MVVISRQLGDTVRSQRDYDSHENTSFHRVVIQGWGGCSWLLSFLLFFVCFTLLLFCFLLLLLLFCFFRGGGCVGIAFYSSQMLFYPLCSELSTSDPNSSVGKDGGC